MWEQLGVITFAFGNGDMVHVGVVGWVVVSVVFGGNRGCGGILLMVAFAFAPVVDAGY